MFKIKFGLPFMSKPFLGIVITLECVCRFNNKEHGISLLKKNHLKVNLLSVKLSFNENISAVIAFAWLLHSRRMTCTTLTFQTQILICKPAQGNNLVNPTMAYIFIEVVCSLSGCFQADCDFANVYDSTNYQKAKKHIFSVKHTAAM